MVHYKYLIPAFSPFPYHHVYLEISKLVHHYIPLAYLFAKGLQLPACWYSNSAKMFNI